MVAILFAKQLARDTLRFGATIGIEHTDINFMGNLALSLWDCGAQNDMMKSYLEERRQDVFSNVQVLIYVLDVESNELSEYEMYHDCLQALLEFSPNALVFCLIHRIDLIQEEQRDKVFRKKREKMQLLSSPKNVTYFATSIWDETLYKAWSTIVHCLIPNIVTIETQLETFRKICGADEVVLFDRETFLVISHSGNCDQEDEHRFEKVSNVIKQFRMSCSKIQSQFQSLQVNQSDQNLSMVTFIEGFTSNTIIMIVVIDDTIQSEAIHLNIRQARKQFQTLL